MFKLRFAGIIGLLLLLGSCNWWHNNKTRPRPDVSNIAVSIHLLRFDQDMRGFEKNGYTQQVEWMHNKYGPFFDFFISHFVIGPQPVGDTTNIQEDAIRKYIADAYIKRIQDSINHYFSDTRDVEQQLTQSFKYTRYYFPEIKTPSVIAINSGFALGAFTYDKDYLAVGLDLYYGPANIDYDSAGIFQYAQHKMRREYITRNSMEVLYNLYFGSEEESRGKALIEAMIDKGKKMYFLSYVLPDAPDSMIVGYTLKQTRWCEDNEYDIWKYLNEKDLLYKNNYMDQKRYLDEGPTTPGMPPESPGNIGAWIGLQIVRKFMKETGNKISLHDLIVKYDSKAILEKARYRPSKTVF
jgi:hypothetical protein